MSLKNKKIIIIGGSSGIGLAAAKALVNEEAEVIIASRSEEKLEKAKDSIGGNVTTYQLDMRDKRGVQNFFDKIGRFDHLVILGSEAVLGNFLELDIEKAQQFFDSKFWGPYCLAKYGAPLINEGGSIIFFSGAAGQKASPGVSATSVINAAVETLSRTLAVELSPIRVNTISPGLIETPVWNDIIENDNDREMILDTLAAKLPTKRFGKPEEVAQTVLYLLQNTYTTGSVIFVDGGFLLT